MTFFLAIRNLVLQRKRYAMIGLAVMIGFALITVISGASGGILFTVKDKAARYFAGNVSVTGYSAKNVQGISEPDRLATLLGRDLDDARVISKRTVYYKQDADLFFGGQMIRQRRLVGVEFASERAEFEDLVFAQGGLEAMLGPDGERGILISESAADLLGARLGDDVELFLTTDTGQYNTASLVVRGIFSEASLFGYVSYMRNEDLNRLLGRAPGAATDIAGYARPGVDHVSLAESVHEILSTTANVLPLSANRDDRAASLSEKRTGEALVIMSLDAQLAQIADILDAFMAVSYFVLAIFVAIVMVGILNTYRVIVYERTREIGTMRALGMARGAVIRLFMTEAAALALVSSIAGLALGAVALRLLGLIDLSPVPAAGMFTAEGRLGFYLDPRNALMNIAAMMAAVTAAASGPARAAGAVRPADAMRASS